ncbi:MAG: FISUMP domain-containing protein [Bacteroidales bacterium]|nr:FISUMP domain-containing protein [Bacteroidales bacterium]
MKKFLTLILFLIINLVIYSQGVTIAVDAGTPDESAILDIRSDSQGLLFPRMTTVQRDAILSPAESLLIFNTDTKCFESWVYGSWQSVWCGTAPCFGSEAASSISGNNLVCTSGNTSLSVVGGTLGTGAQWVWYKDLCSGTPIDYGTSINVSPLANTTYFVRAEGDCDTTSCVSIDITMIDIPDAPVADAATSLGDTYFTANWQSVSTATSYFLEVSEDVGFSSFVLNSDVGNVLFYDMTGLDCSTTYYYRIRAVNSCGESVNSNSITLTTDGCGCSPVPCSGLPTVTYNGYTYNTVQIGTQCWMVENLRTTKYRNGTDINQAETDPLWSAAGTDGRYCSAGSGGDGLFYNYYAANSTNNLCPTGWRTPTSSDFTTLTNNVPNAASIMDNVTWLGDNSCGWTGRNGGYRAANGTYYDSQHGYHWTTSSAGGGYYVDFRLYNNLSYQINTFGSPPTYGEYVRCVKE